MSTYERVKSVLVKSMGYLPEEIEPNYSLWGELAFDSLKMMEFAMALEDEFDISMDDSRDYEKMTVQDIVDVVDVELSKVLTAAR